MSCLITGGTGYIGRHLIDELRKNCHNHGQIYGSGSADFKLDDIDSIRHYFAGKEITHVIHLAAEISNKDAMFSANILGLYNLLLVCKENNIKYFLFSSSNNVYGFYESNIYSEDDILMPQEENWYAISKYVGELIIEDFCSANNIEYGIARIGDVYGSGQKYGNLMKSIVNCVKHKMSLQLYGEGVRERDYIYITDVIRGLVYIYKHQLQGIYNLGTGKGTNIKQLLLIANEISEFKCGVIPMDVKNEDTSKVVLNVAKLKEVGFMTHIDVKQGLLLIIEKENDYE